MCAKNGKRESKGRYLVLLKGEKDTIYIVSRRDTLFNENLLSVFSGEDHYNYFIGMLFSLLDKSLMKFSPAFNYIEMDPVAVKVEDFNKKFVSGATHNFYTCYKDDHMHVGMLKLKNNSKVRNLYNKGTKLDVSISRSLLNINNYNEDFDVEEYIDRNPLLSPQFSFYGISIS
ncbi:MAG: hypothetical protein J6Y02_18140 [Pseudobutyrivibrio sp.]|nr:hypothetical protein [Pseudobutyrivibrio sp.]